MIEVGPVRAALGEQAYLLEVSPVEPEAPHHLKEELRMRTAARGWKHKLACDVFVYHSGSVSFDSVSERQQAHRRLRQQGLVVISLNMAGSVPEAADLVVSDPVQAGVMAVMAVADTAKFTIERLKRRVF